MPLPASVGARLRAELAPLECHQRQRALLEVFAAMLAGLGITRSALPVGIVAPQEVFGAPYAPALMAAELRRHGPTSPNLEVYSALDALDEHPCNLRYLPSTSMALGVKARCRRFRR